MTDIDTDTTDADKKDGVSSELAAGQPIEMTDSQDPTQDPKEHAVSIATQAEQEKQEQQEEKAVHSGTENTADDHVDHDESDVVYSAEVVPSSIESEDSVISLVSTTVSIPASKGSAEAGSGMIAKAKLRGAEMSAQKVRLVADLVRGARVHHARKLLLVTQKKAAAIIHKLLMSAISNAEYNGFDTDNLFISKICVDQGPSTNRWRPRARGRSSRVKHHRCHILIELKEGSKVYFAQRLHKNSARHIKKYLEQSQNRKSRQNQRKRSKITSASKAALT